MFLLRFFALLLLFLVFCALVAVGIVMIHRSRALIRRGVPVRGTVVHVRAQSIDSSFAYHPTIRYELHGRVWESTPKLAQHAMRTQGFWKTHRSGEQFIGMPLDVYVDPQNPAVSSVPGNSRLGILLVVVGAVFGGLTLLLGVIGVIAAFVR